MQTGAEDPNKVTKLVETPGMLELWNEKYNGSLISLQELGLLSVTENEQGKKVEFNPQDSKTRQQLVQQLPARLRKYSDQIIGNESQGCIQKGSAVLRNELAKIVAPAARNQGIKGVLTAGPMKSWKYAMAKFAKGRLKQ